MSIRDTAAIFVTAPTVFPRSAVQVWVSTEQFTSDALGESLERNNAARVVVAGYLQAAGIESGYGFFAPNVPENYKLVFELEYADGRRERDLPVVQSDVGGLRLAGFLDQLAETDYPPLQRAMLGVIAGASLKQHPRASKVRAVLGVGRLPSVAEYRSGAREEYEALATYEIDASSQHREQ